MLQPPAPFQRRTEILVPASRRHPDNPAAQSLTGLECVYVQTCMHFRLCPIHAQTRPRTKTVAFQEALVQCHPRELCVGKTEPGRPKPGPATGFGTSALWNYHSRDALFPPPTRGRAILCHRCAKLSRSDDVRPRAPGLSVRAHLCTRRWARWAGAAMAAVFDLDLERRKAAKARASRELQPTDEWSARAPLDPGSIPSSRRWDPWAPS